jgi:hypothetical protein
MLEAQLDEATQPDPRTPPAGQAGNQVATAFWETILKEHGLNDDGFIAEGATDVQTDRLNVFFSEAEGKKYVPRGLQIDLEPATGDAIRGSKLGHLFRPSGFVFGVRSLSSLRSSHLLRRTVTILLYERARLTIPPPFIGFRSKLLFLVRSFLPTKLILVLAGR